MDHGQRHYRSRGIWTPGSQGHVAVPVTGGGKRRGPPHGFAASWASDLSWDDQPRPERAGPSQAVPEPFRGQTLEERHPTEPAAHYTSEEMRLLCPLCGVPEICRAAQFRGALHGERADAERITRINRIGDRDLERAIALVQRRRPDLLRRPPPSDDHHDDTVIDMPDT
ncbi:hypothetical protein HPB47_015715 [Ixodes persulcatus]|uniref:Uncharacterized protein n=1 Tax=Ixodes persulcatus TaxID=34615 RepID=A0AC60QUQ9_IXOPE|nr:hypothetical protein HPB47_015715 [Ixodes persulcatus]